MQLFVNGPLWRNEVFIADDIQTDAKQQGFCYNGLRSCAAQGRAGADDSCRHIQSLSVMLLTVQEEECHQPLHSNFKSQSTVVLETVLCA